MVGIILQTRLGLDDSVRVTSPSPLFCRQPQASSSLTPKVRPGSLDLASIAGLVLDFGDGRPASAPPPALFPEPVALPRSPLVSSTAHSGGRSRSRSAKGKP